MHGRPPTAGVVRAGRARRRACERRAAAAPGRHGLFWGLIRFNPPSADFVLISGHDMLASRLLCGVRRLAPRQGLASPRRLLCTPAATPPPPPPPLAAEPGVVAHIMKQLGSEVTTGLSKTRWLSLRPAGTPEAAISADHASGYCGLPQARLDPEPITLVSRRSRRSPSRRASSSASSARAATGSWGSRPCTAPRAKGLR